MKLFLMSILLTAVYPYLAWSENEVLFTYPTDNDMVYFRFDDNGLDKVFYRKDDRQNWALLVEGRISAVSKSNFLWPQLPDRIKVVATQTSTGKPLVWIDNQMILLAFNTDLPPGKSHYRLPIETTNVGSLINVSHIVEFSDDFYRFISAEVNGSGVTYLVRRSDGKSIQLNSIYVNEPLNPVVENGILRCNNFHRKIDLLAYDVEASFQVRGKGTVANSRNEQIDAVSFIDSLFDDMKLHEGKPLTLSEADHATTKLIQANLKRSQRASVVLLGEPGTGKTTLVKEAIRGLPRTWRVKVLDATALTSGTSSTGVIEQRLASIVSASEAVPIVWFADEIHTLRGVGTHSNNSNDVLEYFKKPLADGTLKMIATDTPHEYHKKINDPAIQRRLTQIEIKAPTAEDLRAKIRSWLKLQKRPPIGDDLLSYLIETATDFNASENEPSRSIGLLETAFAILDDRTVLDRTAIDRAAQAIYKVDPTIRDIFALRNKIRALPSLLDETIVGQEIVKDSLVNQSKGAMANLHDGTGPRLSLFIAGVPGVGKTEIATAYAQAMGLPFRKIEMARFGSGGIKTADDLMSEIAEQIRIHPFSVIILDEIEKAHPKILESLLTFMSSDRFTAYEKMADQGSRSVQVSSKNSSLIMTSNAGSSAMKEYFEGLTGDQRDQDRRLFSEVFNRKWIKQAAIAAGIPESLIDRTKGVAAALPPTATELRRVLALHATKKMDQIRSKMKIEIDFLNIEALYDRLLAKMVQEDTGSARRGGAFALFTKVSTGGTSNRDVLVELKEKLDVLAAEILMHEAYGQAKAFEIDLKTSEIRQTSSREAPLCAKVFAQ